MSVELTVKTNERKLSVKLRKKGAKISSQTLISMTTALRKLRGAEVNDLVRGRFGLKTDSGALMRSLAIDVRKRGSEVVGLMGTNLPYGRMHEFGGTIRPKGSGFLTIPFPGITGTAREYDNTFFHRYSAGTLIMFQETGPRTIRPLFTLVKSVRVKKKKWMSKSYKGTKKDILMIMRKGLREALA